ncbi:ribokinase [Defluviimonas aestuarii]|uniref:ribokinase n=1 Tax=Albidovulum aestuarii TaxID=1130726 RepID=UPI00249C406E|nr:ribokinase [Defluviimonas aestuarii]MDI3338575.1 ribokinase [Defluviimonas aestuarii]
MRDSIVILGVFVADTSYRAERQPRIGETILGNSFVLGPGGKGSNQSVAAAMAGADVRFVTRLGRDAFAEIARATWAKAGVTADVTEDADSYTGAAYIFIEEATGNNAIIIAPGAAGRISVGDVEARAEAISSAAIFLTQLEQPMAAARRGLEIARAGGAITILNPAPAAAIAPEMLQLCDYVTPNESEAEGITGIAVRSIADAERAAGQLLEQGVGAAIITLGENGVLYRDRARCVHVPAAAAGPVVETTGAGDAFNGAFAAELARGADPVAAVRFGCAGAGISVTRPGTAPSMPSRSEVEAFLASGSFN